MSNSFGYLDIILLGMIAGFIILRLRSILGRKTGHETKIYPGFAEKKFNIPKNDSKQVKQNHETLEGNNKKEFLKGAEIAYETIITDFSDEDNKLTKSKSLLNEKIENQFNKALQERGKRGHFAEITFIGINSANIKEHKKTNDILKVTVDFVAEVITCIRDSNKNIISGDPEKIKKIYDTWVFSRDVTSVNPNWKLVNILT